jgi:hypothetical protein
VNPNKKSFYAPACPFCGDRKCLNCPLSTSSELKLKDILKVYFKAPKPKKSSYGNANIIGDIDSDEEKGKENDPQEEAKEPEVE